MISHPSKQIECSILWICNPMQKEKTMKSNQVTSATVISIDFDDIRIRVLGDADDQFTGGPKRDFVFGGLGNDVLVGGAASDLLSGGGGDDQLFGGRGDDYLSAGAGNDEMSGGRGDDLLIAAGGEDTLNGGAGDDLLRGGRGVDTVTGGAGDDVFIFRANAITDASTPLVANVGGTGIDAKVSADAVTDFTDGEDKVKLDLDDFGIEDPIVYQVGETADLADGNFIVQTDSFANVGEAAAAIAANDNVTADEGFFIYFNTTLGFSRLVYSSDLGDAGDVTVLANFTNQTGAEGLANISNFSLDDFLLV
jgi:serralysin